MNLKKTLLSVLMILQLCLLVGCDSVSYTHLTLPTILRV